MAARIETPYSLHHSDADIVVPLALDRSLAGILALGGTEHRLVTAPYQGLSHADMSANPLMLQRVRSWYLRHGLMN